MNKRSNFKTIGLFHKALFVAVITLIFLVSISLTTLARENTIQLDPDINDFLGFAAADYLAESLGLLCTDDVHGANDQPGQKDLTRRCSDTSVDALQVVCFWEVWLGGGARTYDACSLFDTDSDGNANYSFCTTVIANPTSDLMEYKTVTLYSCGDDKPDRCTLPINVETPSPGTGCSVSQLELDPFPAGAEYPWDTVGSCSIVRDDVGGDVAVMLNVCSFPSQQPNSNPSDCIAEPGSGFITVVKDASPDIDSIAIEFAVNDGTSDVYNPIINGSGTSDRLPVIEGTYSVTETVPADWSLDSASCEDIVLGPVGTPNLSENGVFEIAIQSGSNVTCTFTDSRVYSPAITTTPKPAEGYVGDTLQDSAELTGGYNPTGTITFKLYDPADATCSELVVYSEIVPVSGNGVYNTTIGHKTTKDGVYRWVADYSGDDHNNPDSSGCDEEQVTIRKYITSLTTTPNPISGKVGDTLNDTATVTSDYELTGDVTFKLYEPGDNTCQSPVFTQTVTLVNGSASTNPGYKSNMEGTWRWTAEYPGDFANLPSSSGCQDEQVTITIYPTSILTIPEPADGKVADFLNDSATVTSEFELTGTVTFNLYKPGDTTCLTSVYTQTVPVGDGNVSTDPGYENDMDGIWRWTAEYSGDYANAPSKSGCDDEQVKIDKYDPSIRTEPDPTNGLVGVVLNDKAILASDYELTGEVVFNLYEPGDVICQTPVYTQTVPVSQAIPEAVIELSTDPGYPSDTAGTWRWTAEYLGDFANYPSKSGCDDELVPLIKDSPAIRTSPDPEIGFIWDRLHDTAVLTGGFNPTGTVKFTLYEPLDATCQTPTYEEIVPLVEGEASTETGFVSNQPGVWRWKAEYSGDVNNNPAESGCDDEMVTIQLHYLFFPIIREDFTPPICSFTWRQTYNGYQARIDLVWENAASPEEAPEAHRVKWGDNTHTKFTGESGSRAFWHTYAEPGWYYVYIMLWGHDGQKYFPCSDWVDPP